jgi:hypothetical protein
MFILEKPAKNERQLSAHCGKAQPAQQFSS